MRGVREDTAARDLARKQPFDIMGAVEFVRTSAFVTRAIEHATGNNLPRGTHYHVGACRRGPARGLSQLCKLHQGMCELLVAIARASCPYATFTTVSLSVNTHTFPQGKEAKPETMLHYIPLVMPQDSEQVWTELLPGSVVTGQPTLLQQPQCKIMGQLHQGKRTVDNPPHGTWAMRQRAEGHNRVALILSTQANEMELQRSRWTHLQKLGFPVSMGRSEGGDHTNPEVAEHKHSHGIPQEVGTGEGHSQFAVAGCSSQHSDGFSQEVGTGEGCPTVEQAKQFLCRVCESFGQLSPSGTCGECGCIVVDLTDKRASTPGWKRDAF